jgi:hypothetical protein
VAFGRFGKAFLLEDRKKDAAFGKAWGAHLPHRFFS